MNDQQSVLLSVLEVRVPVASFAAKRRVAEVSVDSQVIFFTFNKGIRLSIPKTISEMSLHQL